MRTRGRLRVVPHFSSGIVGRAKRERAVKITPREKRRHAAGREKNLVIYFSLSRSGREGEWGGRLFEVGRLLTFSAFRMGAYSRWALI